MVDSLEENGRSRELLLVEASALPEVYVKVAQASDYLRTGQAASAVAAARMAGISRSAFYKYKDAVRRYDEPHTRPVMTLHGVLRDKPGVLSDVLGIFARANANVLTVFQDIPTGGNASVSVTADVGRMTVSSEQLIRQLEALPGVARIASVSHQAHKSGG